MPWITKFDQYAYNQMKAYEVLENSLKDKKQKIADNLLDASNRKQVLKNKVDNMGNLCGDYLLRYEKNRDNYFANYSQIYVSFDSFLKDLNRAISQCSSKKAEWNNKIYTSVWEEPKEEKKNVRN